MSTRKTRQAPMYSAGMYHDPEPADTRGKAATFDHLQANVKGITHGKPDGSSHFQDAANCFGLAYIRECIRLGIIGGTWASLRNSMVLGATQPTAGKAASWECERCPGSERYVGTCEAFNCTACLALVPVSGKFVQAHKRPARVEV